MVEMRGEPVRFDERIAAAAHGALTYHITAVRISPPPECLNSPRRSVTIAAMRSGPLGHFDAHHRLGLAVVATGVAFFLTLGRTSVPVQIIVVWNAFCWSLLLLAWMRIIWGEPAAAARVARLQDSSRTLIFLIVVICTCASMFAVGYLLGTAKSLQTGRLTGHVLLAVGTVMASWSLMHTVFALHYAHIYYRKGDEDVGTEDDGGVQFPGDTEPNFMDFSYFSFVIGMTCQVSDVQITSKRIRKLALIHGVLSFVFNTAILALSINIISSLF